MSNRTALLGQIVAKRGRHFDIAFSVSHLRLCEGNLHAPTIFNESRKNRRKSRSNALNRLSQKLGRLIRNGAKVDSMK
jgi:hypothetical protein